MDWYFSQGSVKTEVLQFKTESIAQVIITWKVIFGPAVGWNSLKNIHLMELSSIFAFALDILHILKRNHTMKIVKIEPFSKSDANLWKVY